MQTSQIAKYLVKIHFVRTGHILVCAVFSCVQEMLWLPVFGIFNVRTDVDSSDWSVTGVVLTP